MTNAWSWRKVIQSHKTIPERATWVSLEWRRLSSLTTTEWAAGAVDIAKSKRVLLQPARELSFRSVPSCICRDFFMIWPKLKHLPDSEFSWICFTSGFHSWTFTIHRSFSQRVDGFPIIPGMWDIIFLVANLWRWRSKKSCRIWMLQALRRQILVASRMAQWPRNGGDIGSLFNCI